MFVPIVRNALVLSLGKNPGHFVFRTEFCGTPRKELFKPNNARIVPRKPGKKCHPYVTVIPDLKR
jgi:hypothetical protein